MKLNRPVHFAIEEEIYPDVRHCPPSPHPAHAHVFEPTSSSCTYDEFFDSLFPGGFRVEDKATP